MTSDRRTPSPLAALARCMLGTVVLIVRRLRLRRTNGLHFPMAFGLGGRCARKPLGAEGLVIGVPGPRLVSALARPQAPCLWR